MKSIIFFLLVMLSNTALSNTYYLDPINGNNSNIGSITEPWRSLEEIIDNNFIQSREYSNLPYTIDNPLIVKNPNGSVTAGDTLILREGLHGNIFLRNYINDSSITIIGYPGETAILEQVHLQACKNWDFENIHVSSEPYGYYSNTRLFYVESHGWQGPTSHINISNCEIYSSVEPWVTAQEWIDHSSDGLFIKADSCIATNNKIQNIDMGLTCLGDYIQAEGNQIINFSGDGGRVLGSNISFNYNLIKNNYKVDDNHDDGIQSFTTNGYIVNNNELIGNLIINSDDENQILSGPLQGIACFDGFYEDWLIANNIISVNHWHGITFLGARRCTIIHNTVIDPTPNVTPGASWIRIADHKDGTPSSDCLVANNVANNYVVTATEFSNVVLDSQSSYNNHFVDFSSFDFSLQAASSFINSADANFSISTDNAMQQRDSLPDIGALEFIENISSTSNIHNEDPIVVFPNPFSYSLSISNLASTYKIYCYDMQGALLCNGNLKTINQKLQLASAGIYNLVIIDKETSKVTVKKIYKY